MLFDVLNIMLFFGCKLLMINELGINISDFKGGMVVEGFFDVGFSVLYEEVVVVWKFFFKV